MVKRVLCSLVLVLLIPMVVWGQQTVCTSSGTKLVAGGNIAIKATGGKLCGVVITTNGTNNANIEVWNNASAASGTAVFNMTVVGADYRGGIMFPIPINAPNGLFLDFNTCTACSVEVYYQ